MDPVELWAQPNVANRIGKIDGYAMRVEGLTYAKGWLSCERCRLSWFLSLPAVLTLHKYVRMLNVELPFISQSVLGKPGCAPFILMKVE